MFSNFRGESEDEQFDEPTAFVPKHLPRPGEFLAGLNVLTGEDHVDVHQMTAELFEERGVYDMTFGYNLARLNLDSRHPDAGFRYAEESPSVLRAEFTPTTEFCPQGETLAKGAFRAWNALSDRHGYDLVRVRIAPSHTRSEAVNEALAEIETEYCETGELPDSGHREHSRADQ